MATARARRSGSSVRTPAREDPGAASQRRVCTAEHLGTCREARRLLRGLACLGLRERSWEQNHLELEHVVCAPRGRVEQRALHRHSAPDGAD